MNTLHTTYCRLTSGTANLKVWESDWHAFQQAGYSEDDLRCYLEYLKRENKRMNGATYSLALHKFLDREFKYFDSVLSMARASERNCRKVTARDKALGELRPEAGEPPSKDKVVSIQEALRKAIG